MSGNLFVLASIPTFTLFSLIPGGTSQLVSDVTYKKYTDHLRGPWQKAQAYCREHHTDLLTITIPEQSAQFVSTNGWMGLYQQDANSSWRWSHKDELAWFTTWDEGEPSSSCGYMDESEWTTMSCDGIGSFLCFDETLILVKENKTWEEALDHCRSLGGEDSSDPAALHLNYTYDLPSLITPDDHKFVRKIAEKSTTDEVWTGLRFLAGQWFWVGGEAVKYEGLPSCPGLKSCGVLKKNGNSFFSIRDCTERRNFFCHRKSFTMKTEKSEEMNSGNEQEEASSYM